MLVRKEKRDWTMADARNTVWDLLLEGYSVTMRRQRSRSGSPDVSFLIVGVDPNGTTIVNPPLANVHATNAEIKRTVPFQPLQPKPEPGTVGPKVFYADPANTLQCRHCGKALFEHFAGGRCEPPKPERWDDNDVPDDDEEDNTDTEDTDDSLDDVVGTNNGHFKGYMAYPNRCINCGKLRDDHIRTKAGERCPTPDEWKRNRERMRSK